MRVLLAISIVVGLSSCFKQDVPVKPYDRGDAVAVEIAMGENYAEQLFYDLNTNSIVRQNPRTAWDFCYSSTDGEDIIKLNSGRFMFAAHTGQTDLAKVTDTSGLTFKWDYINGKPDSLALYGWEEGNPVFVLNMGFDEEASEMGFIKIQFTKIDANTISFKYSKLDGTDAGSGELVKDQKFNYVYYSTIEQSPVAIEPPKEDYDLYFGQYVVYFLEEDQEYYVNGVLLNPYKVEAATAHNESFELIDRSMLEKKNFSTKPDIIGYNWKFFDFQASRYEIAQSYNFAVKDVEGFYYKLRFTGFYNKAGIKGFPQLEIERL